MINPILEIIEPGIFTTVQDQGRYGYQRYGVPVSGAMDSFALRAGNLMVNNPQTAAGLEMTVIGPTMRFLSDTFIAITGADLSPQIDGKSVPQWQTVEVTEGSEISFHGMEDGMRAYFAIIGGIDVPFVMKSRSTYTPMGIGGYEGRQLIKGDILSALASNETSDPIKKYTLPDGQMPPVYGTHHELRVILGPQHSAFNPNTISKFLHSTYTIALESDRMGYKLDGPSIQHETGPDIISDGNPLGAIQVTGDGIPTILLGDRGTTGGYTKIATVIGADINKIGQALPGQTVTFKSIGIEEAHRALKNQETLLNLIPQTSIEMDSATLTITIDNETFEVVNEEGETLLETGFDKDQRNISYHNVTAIVNESSFDLKVGVRKNDNRGK